jgi:DNA-binding NarL/FixJ family response regulator
VGSNSGYARAGDATQVNGLVDPREKLTAFLADCRPLALDGMIKALSEVAFVEIVGRASNQAEAFEVLTLRQPAIAAVAHRPPTLAADTLLADLAEARVPTRLLILVDRPRSGFAKRLVDGGAAACLPATISQNEFIAAILACGTLGLTLPLRTPGSASVNATAFPLRLVDADLLSRREREVLQLLAHDKSAGAIAEELVVATATVRTHLARIYAKLVVSSAAGAVAEGLRRGLIE